MMENDELDVVNPFFATQGYLVGLEDANDPEHGDLFGLEFVNERGQNIVIVMTTEQRIKLGEALARWESGERDK